MLKSVKKKRQMSEKSLAKRTIKEAYGGIGLSTLPTECVVAVTVGQGLTRKEQQLTETESPETTKQANLKLIIKAQV